MKLLMENWRTYLEEDDSMGDFASFVNQEVSTVAKNIEKKKNNKGEVEESVVGVALTGFAVVQFSKLIVKLAIGGWRTLQKKGYVSKDLGNKEAGDKILKWIEKSDKFMRKPFLLLVKKFGNKEESSEEQEKKAEILFEVFQAALLGIAAIQGVVGIASSGTKVLSSGTAKAALSGIVQKSSGIKESGDLIARIVPAVKKVFA
jgi:hypothetical protein